MTNAEIWFTRARLNREAPDLAPLIGRLLPGKADDENLNATHQLLWTLMPRAMQQAGKPGLEGGGDRAAFLWRQAEEPNCWYLLGPRPRQDASFFTVETKPYELVLERGDRLAFDLIVNATVNRLVDPSKGRDGRRRCDVVMDALKAEERLAGGRVDRAARRQLTAKAALKTWMSEQGARHGFVLELDAFDLISYRTVEINRPAHGRGGARSRGRPLMGVAHIRGIVSVTDAAAFAAKVVTGFGRAKAFGCGLMLLRRA
jgi:CRISPR-associated protein Cas6/Cse3/CasE, subtype I-E/ECOLI